MAEGLSKLDYNNDQKINADELKKALEDKFFDDQKNIEAITKAMQHNESEIKIMMTEAYKDYLENLDTDKLQVLYRDEGSVASKKLFQLASTNILGINSLFGKTITIDGKIGDQGKTLINLLYITGNNQADPQLISSVQNLTTKLKKHNLTIFELFEGSKKEYIQFLFKQNPYLISQALDTCPNLDIFSSDYPLNKYLTEYINTNGNLSEETKQMFSKAQKYFEDQKKYQTQKEQFKYKHNDIFKIYPKQITDLRGSLNNLSENLQCAKDNYNSIYAEFVKILESNNSIYQKIKDISPILLLPTMPSLGWDILGKSSLSAEEKKQLKTYNNLKKSYEEVKSIEKQIQKVQKNIETKEIKRAGIYYELLRDYGNQKDADQALINLVAKYGTVIQKEYEDEINKASKRVGEVSRAILKADKQQLQKYMKQKSLAIDIAQQILSPSKAVFKKCNQENIKHLGLGQIESLLSQDQKIQAVIGSRTTAVSDNTAVARHGRTADYAIADGNIMGTELSYRHTEGKTSIKGNEMANMYQLASKQFQYLDIPGIGVILTRIQPSLYQQILDTKLSPNQKIVYNPQYNKDLEAFELCESDIYVGWKDTKGDIGYRPLSNQNTSYIKAKEYQSLLQVKEGYNTIVKQNEKIKSVSEYMTHLSETANNIQQIANTYAENPGDELLSEAIIADITKPDGLQSQLKGLRKMLSSNDQYKSIIDEIIANKGGMYDHHEKELHAIQKQLQSLNQYAEELDKLLNYSVWEGAESRNLREFVVQVTAIAVGIGAASLTGGFGILATTMIMTGASMVSARATQDIFARSTDTKGLTNDLHSDIVKCINNQEKRSEVMPNIALEFAQGTATTAIFIGGGRIVGKQLEKFVLANAGNTSLEVKIAYRTRKAISKLNDQEVQLLEKRGFSLFMKNFGKEFVQEGVESSAERGAEKGGTSVGKGIDRLLGTNKFGYIGGSLSSLVSMVTCISGKRGYRAGGVEVFMEGFDSQNQTTTVSYTGDVNSIQSQLIQTASGAGYVFQGNTEGNLTFTRNDNGNQSKLVFRPMQESVGIKSLNLASHLQQYGVKYQETQNGNFDYTYNHMIVNQNNLVQYLTRNGMVLQGNIQADESFTVLSPQGETITFHKTTPKLKKDLSTNINPNSQTQEDGTSAQTGGGENINEDEGSTQTDDEGDMNGNKDEGEEGQGEEKSSRTSDELEQNIQKDITQTQEDLSDAIQKGQNKKFITIMKKIRSRRNELGRKTILQTLKTTTSSYKTEIKQGIKMLLDNIGSEPQTALQGLKMLTSNGLKLGIVLFNLLPISPVPGSGTVLLLGLLLNEFKTKGPLHDAIMELHNAVMDDPPSQPNIAQQPSVLSEVYLTHSSMKISKTTVPDEQKRIFEKIPGYEDIKLGSHILDLHRGETSDASEIKSGFKALQEKLLQAKNNGEKLPSHILGLSNLSFILGKYGFSIFDSLPVEVYTQVGQYKRLFGEIDPKNPLTPAELKQKKRIGQYNNGKNPIKAAIIDTESFLKLNFNGQNENIQSVFTKPKIDDSQEINQFNINQKDISDFENDGSFSPETAKFNDYFGKESRFGFDSKQARDHSAYMDKVAAWFKKGPSNLAEGLDDVRDKIQKLYTDKTGKLLELTDAQIRTIIDTHLKPGGLGKLTQAELRAKVKELEAAIPDADVRRFLLEAGFCGINSYEKSYVDLMQLGFTENEITPSLVEFHRDSIIPLLDTNIHLDKGDIIDIQSTPKENIERYITLYKKYDLGNKLGTMCSFYLPYIDESFESKLLNYLSIKEMFDKVYDGREIGFSDINGIALDNDIINKFGILYNYLIDKELKINRNEFTQLENINIELLKRYIKEGENDGYLKVKGIDSISMLLSKGKSINKMLMDLDNTWFSPREKFSYQEYGYTSKEMIAYETMKVSHIIDRLEQTIHDHHSTGQSIELARLLTTVKSDLMELSLSNRVKVIEQVAEACTKIAHIKHYLDFEKGPYKSPKDLLIAMRGITDPDVLKAIDCDITVEQYGVSIVFYVSDRTVYDIIYNRGFGSNSNSGGFSHLFSAIPELNKTLVVCNGSQGSSKHIGEVKIHEDRHMLYNYLKREYESSSEVDYFLRRAQNEIIAQWKGGKSISDVEYTMINDYDYIKKKLKPEGGVLSDSGSLSPDQQQEYDRLQSLYQPKLQEALQCLEKFYILGRTYPNINLSKERIMNILSTTPIQKRGKIYDIFSGLIEVGDNKIENGKQTSRLQMLKNKFIEILQTIKDKSPVKKLLDIYNDIISKVTKEAHRFTMNQDDYYKKHLNSETSDQHIIEKSNSAWWSHTNTIEHTTHALEGISSIDELTKTLLDPQYSHIQYGQYDKISSKQIVAMIPQIQQGILPIESIPIELRSYITKFIK